MTLSYLHRMHGPASYPAEAAERAPHILKTWLRYSPDAKPEIRDFEDWAENAIMLHEADRISGGKVRLLDADSRIRMHGDCTSYVPSRPGAAPAFMYGMWRGSDSVSFPDDVDMVGNNAEAVRAVSAYPTATAFLEAAGRDFHICDADTHQLNAVLKEMHDAGHREVFIKTRFKESACRLTMPAEADDLWYKTVRGSDLEWFLVQHEGAKGVLFIQGVFEPTHEYRMIIVGDQVSTGAGCVEAFTPLDNRGDLFDPRTEEVRNRSSVTRNPDIVARYIEFARSFAQVWATEVGDDMMYSLDLALDATTGNIRAIELNPMTNLGLYACNSAALADAIADVFAPAKEPA
ncbi:hypothetical protein [Erythrobacter aureus]|uniref:ATP-grasp domain-containing protein n=1 Tax=Erythrobacter aureus TaxID=2182384 RepID=A0A345YJ10_9SPHN|nr:hypothetical protein [Erythrobacter aureus]AXK43912.1 hypothetical protein DVR09_15775 [Erythrobacter aureus]